MTDTPAGAPLPGATGATGPREVVSVSELLARHSAASDDSRHGSGPLTGPVLSVGDLLRREGRTPATSAPASADVPAAGVPGDWPDIDLPQPRSAGDRDWPARTGSGRRRAGAVAGALVAAGSVLGAALYNGATSHDSDAQAAADGLFPGVALPAGEVPETLPGQYLPTTVALSAPMPELPATAPGASDWMSVAFPQRSAAAGTLRQVSTGTGSGAAAAIPTQRTTTAAATTPPSGPGPGSGTDTRPRTGSTGTGSPVGGLAPVRALNEPDRPSAGNLLEPVASPGPSGGDTGTGALQRVTEPVRPVVGGVADGAVAPVARAAGPVGETLGGAVKPVTGALSPVTDAVQPVTRPLADTLEPVTTPVLGALSPVTEPVLGATEPLTGPVLEAAEPVTGLLDTSAKTEATASRSGSTGSGSSNDEGSQPLQKVTKPVGETLGTVTEPVGGLVGGVTKGAGSLLGGG